MPFALLAGIALASRALDDLRGLQARQLLAGEAQLALLLLVIFLLVHQQVHGAFHVVGIFVLGIVRVRHDELSRDQARGALTAGQQEHDAVHGQPLLLRQHRQQLLAEHAVGHIHHSLHLAVLVHGSHHLHLLLTAGPASAGVASGRLSRLLDHLVEERAGVVHREATLAEQLAVAQEAQQVLLVHLLRVSALLVVAAEAHEQPLTLVLLLQHHLLDELRSGNVALRIADGIELLLGVLLIADLLQVGAVHSLGQPRLCQTGRGSHALLLYIRGQLSMPTIDSLALFRRQYCAAQ
mmetsp:Transcript_6598/g.10798  ORF Transcript_6598/g.10798 Transcript_6598/m.10798 type:complete len:295 (+) Transcript_6598:575-1459(+)